MLKVLLLTALTFTFEAATLNFEARHSHTSFDDYRMKFNRSYKVGSEEYDLRKMIFHQRVLQIKAHNANPAKLWTAGLTSITDLTDSEFAQKRGWRRTHARTSHSLLQLGEVVTSNSTLTPVILEQLTPDWTHLLMANKVPDQGGCGSCWAVASMSLLEGRYESQLKKHRTFSVQELIDCVDNPRECGGQGGCQGATVELAMEYVAKKGLQNAHTAPYLGEQRQCSPSSFVEIGALGEVAREHGRNDFQVARWEKLPENEAEPLMRAAVEGPVAVSVSANSWDLYLKGIFNGCTKDAVIDHAVTLFGYGKNGKAKYWHLRNSWGRSWGEGGFIKLLRQDSIEEEDSWCGTDRNPKLGVACKPYPDTVPVCGMCGVLYDSVAVQFADSSRSSDSEGLQPEARSADVGIGTVY